MTRQSRLDWFASRTLAQAAGRGRTVRRVPQRRPLRFEPLEDRRLLSITVNTLIDENDGVGVGDISLRDAIAAAPNDEIIDFDASLFAAGPATISLTHGELVINKPLSISGPGAHLLTIDASPGDDTPNEDNGDGHRVFLIDDGSFGTAIEVEIAGLSLTGGDADGHGGGIDSRGNLHLIDSIVVGNAALLNGGGISHTGGLLTLSTVAIINNRAEEGGGLYNDGAEAQIYNSQISRNRAVAGGGGIFNWLDAGLLVSDSSLQGNSSTDGAAILNKLADFTVVGSTISGNTALQSGGGIRNSAGTGTVFGSALTGNVAKYGGGIYVDTALDQATTISNSTISGNTATEGGGGIYNFTGRTVIQFSTIADNKAQFQRGGGVVSWGDPISTLTAFHSTIVAGNLDPAGDTGTDVDQVGGPIGGPFDSVQSNGYNLIVSGNALDLFDADGDLTEVDPLLAPLADNGGPSLTHALLFGSPALDAGNPDAEAGDGAPVSDQRGDPFSRVFDGNGDSVARIDIGALESDAVFFVVDTIDDESNGIGTGAGTSLREAFDAASFVSAGTPWILFAPELTSEGPTTIHLTLGQLTIDSRMVVVGPGAERLAIDAQGNSRVLSVDNGIDVGPLDVKISGLTLTGGSDVNGGGAIFSQERLTVSDSVISGNSAQWGGGIYNAEFGVLTVLRTRISGNHAIEPAPGVVGSGGGLYNWGGTATVLDSTITGNDSVSYGGGFLNANGATLSIVRSTISENVAAMNGGGIHNGDGDVFVSDSTISGNEAQIGGGIAVNTPNDHVTRISNSTVSGNRAPGGGGGIDNQNGQTIIEFSTITRNVSLDFAGSGVRSGPSPLDSPTSFYSTIVAANFDPSGGTQAAPFDLAVSSGANSFVSHGFNLVGIGDFIDDTFIQPGDQIIGTDDPGLGPLADNGGPTWTHALLNGSPAIDAGDPIVVPGIGEVPEFDQRGDGFGRVRDGDAAEDIAIDIGAFEVQQFAVIPELLGDYNRDNTVDAADYTVWRNTLGNDVAPYDGADGDGDGKVDAEDHGVWKSHFGESIESGGSAAGSFSLAGTASVDGLIVVTTLDDVISLDDGVTSLREAIFAANIVSGQNTIEFDATLTASGPATILLTLGELFITDSLIIAGPGAGALSIDASGNDFDLETFGNGSRVFTIDDQLTSNIDVAISDLRLTGGDIAESGGAINSRENLTAARLLIEGNRAQRGGAISLFVNNGSSSITDCNLLNNTATLGGGAVAIQAGNLGAALLSGNTIVGNSASTGGAIFADQSNLGSTLTIDSTVMRDNSATQRGGAVALMNASVPKTTIRDSTISLNKSGAQGGGIFASMSRDISIYNTTITENRSLGTSPSLSRGGGIYGSGAEFNITASTISGNEAFSGGGINSRNGELNVNFSSVAENSATSGDGGGIYSNVDRLSIIGSSISGNTTTGNFSQGGRGGGLMHTIGPAPATILSTDFTGNSASNFGGGAFFQTLTDGGGSSILLKNANFSTNSSSRGGGLAVGAAGRLFGSVVIDGGRFSGNSATIHGGGIYGGAYSISVHGSTITGNHADGNGGGVAATLEGSSPASMSFVGATITRNSAGTGLPSGAVGFGGGIYIPSSGFYLSLLETSVSENSARIGGGIARMSSSIAGATTVTDSAISGNTSLSNGGGIYHAGGVLSFIGSTIANNIASTINPSPVANGGGIFGRNADVSLIESSLIGNSTTSGRGGGLFLDQMGDLSVSASTISGNFARQDGGGVWGGAFNDRVLVQSSTVSGNSSTQGTGGLYLRGNISVRNTTITKNVGGGTRPGGLLPGDGARQFELDHSIVAGNSHGSGGPADLRLFLSPPNVTIRYSLIGDNTSTPLAEAPLGSPDIHGNLVGMPLTAGGGGVINPLLGPLADNGGPTLTHALLPGSPALDGGTLASGQILGYDQRGNPYGRMVDGTGEGVVRIDVGAYESQGVPTFSAGDYTRDGIVDACDYLLWRNTLDSEVAPFAGADGDGDGTIDADDYQIWKSHFGDGLVISPASGGAALSAAIESELLFATEAAVESATGVPLMLPARSASGPSVARRSTAVIAARTADDRLIAWLANQSSGRSNFGDLFDPSPRNDNADDSDADSIATAFDAAFAEIGDL